MAQTVEKTTGAGLLGAVYQSVKEATEQRLGLMPKVEDEILKHDMTVQISVYEGFASRAAKLLAEVGEKPEDAGTMQKIGEKMSAMIEGMRLHSSKQIAKVLIDAAQKRADEILSKIRLAETELHDGESLHLARHLCEYEHEQMERLKSYL